jgi:hypothetical protein
MQPTDRVIGHTLKPDLIASGVLVVLCAYAARNT